MKFKELDEVRLKYEIPYEDREDKGILPAGTKGVIVYMSGENDQYLMVEFFEPAINEEGYCDTICVIDIYASMLEIDNSGW
ncbi:hypothetical protein [Leptospira meyeri]|uniref:hypothetical protein n=1 Tax=Leptospira meyeri TaxID=29508 RepID=UPI001082ABC5|nr:hypothetical protein [Leptospira meyeri]TGL10105.1 hypothetical protein EHQ50_18360 [Leptospira meyeri]